MELLPFGEATLSPTELDGCAQCSQTLRACDLVRPVCGACREEGMVRLPELPAPPPCDYPDRRLAENGNGEGEVEHDSKEKLQATQRDERSRRLNALEERMAAVERAIRLRKQAAISPSSSRTTSPPPPLDLAGASSSRSSANSVIFPIPALLPPPIAALVPSPTATICNALQIGDLSARQQGSWQARSSEESELVHKYAAGVKEAQHNGTLPFQQQQERAFQQPTPPPIEAPRRPSTAGPPRVTQADPSSSIYRPPPPLPSGSPLFTQLPLQRQRHSVSLPYPSLHYASPPPTSYSSLEPFPRPTTNDARRFSHPPNAHPLPYSNPTPYSSYQSRPQSYHTDPPPSATRESFFPNPTPSFQPAPIRSFQPDPPPFPHPDPPRSATRESFFPPSSIPFRTSSSLAFDPSPSIAFDPSSIAFDPTPSSPFAFDPISYANTPGWLSTEYPQGERVGGRNEGGVGRNEGGARRGGSGVGRGGERWSPYAPPSRWEQGWERDA